MKKQFKSLLLVAIFACTTLSAWSQASTQGKEFWVSSTIACSPEKDQSKVKTANPYIAISAEKACTVTIKGGIGNAINITQPVLAGSWNEFGNTSKPYNTQTSAPINAQMDAQYWYPINTKHADDVISLAGKTYMYGLHITATENISVYVILSAENSMDASNILPVTAIGSEYYTQDYSPEANDFSKIVGMTTILATENGTKVDITPSATTYEGKPANATYTVDLDEGQIYYLMTQINQQLSGTHIQARNGKKIAVYNGAALTRIPNGRAARDCLFEQSMPLEYWGTQFIATRSLEKDGNIIGITATQTNTKIKVDGYVQATINAGETYYILLQNNSDPWSTSGTITSTVDQVLVQDAAYIETSCPCAVFCYDTGRDFKGKTGSEVQGHFGDPSSVWVSPIQQKINKITFGTCYTNKTKDHFLNVVTETATCKNTKLTAIYGATQLDKSSLLVWQPVPGNPTYSYARTKIGEASTSQFSVFRLENARGFTATIYGNGDDESYAYSAGSAAVEMGINVNGVTFTNGYRSDEKFCISDSVLFDAAVGTDEIKRVEWEFGDGTTEYGPVQTAHEYSTPGWYDVSARLYGRQVCTDDPEMELGTVSFTFRVWRPDTVIGGAVHECITVDGKLPDGTQLTEEQIADLLANGSNDTLPQVNCYDDVVINLVNYGLETEETLDTIVGQDVVYYNGNVYYADTAVTDTLLNEYNCNHYVHYFVHVKTCLGLTITNSNQHICPGEKLDVDYAKTKGNIKNPVRFEVEGLVDETFDMSDANTSVGLLSLPTASITMPGKYQGKLTIEDANECETKEITIDFTVNYPSDIFKYKFNNVLAVYKPGQGGNEGWTFIAYQWYRNGEAIPGATQSVYHIDSTFTWNDVYYVELTTADGVTIPSCSQSIGNVPDYTPQPASAPVKKMLINRRIMIRKEDKTYDIYGQRVE